MEEFDIRICSFPQVRQFVTLASDQPFEIIVGNDRQLIDGKDFMGMCTLDFAHPLHVSASCTAEEGMSFLEGIREMRVAL